MIARSEQEGLPVRPVEIEVRTMLERLRSRFAARVTAGGRTIDLETPPELRVVADSQRLEQAIGNMVDNALRHGDGTIVLRAAHDDGSVALHVLDSGAGFRDGFAADAFERFSRADPARGRGGAGLGLAIVAAIAKAHGGSAGARNRPQGGADVWLSLPAS